MIENPTYTYYIKKSEEGEENYRVPEGAENITLNEYTFRGLEDGVSYDIKVEVREDKAGNMGYRQLRGTNDKSYTRRRYRTCRWSNNIWKCRMGCWGKQQWLLVQIQNIQ